MSYSHCISSRMNWLYTFLFLLTSSIQTRETAISNPVLVQCSNATLSNDGDTGSCWKDGTSVMCNSLEHGLREAELLGMSMLVENTSQCTIGRSPGGETPDSNGHTTSLLDTNGDRSWENKYSKDLVELMNRRDDSSAVGANTPNHALPVNTSCPPGFVPELYRANISSLANQSTCKCLDDARGYVRCTNIRGSELAFILGGHCMTYDKSSGDTIIGDCVFSCQVEQAFLDGHTNYLLLPKKNIYLEKLMCEKLHRKGYLCSECHPGHKASAYSYSVECIPCNLSRKQLALNWMGYFALAVLPQSILFLLMAIFRVGVTAPPFSSMIQVFQTMTAPQYIQATERWLKCLPLQQNSSTTSILLLHLLVTFYGFFNLDFFRTLSPSLCLDLDFIQLQMLDYASAFWPLLLIILSYIFVELHSQGFILVVLIWKPVQLCLRRFQRQWQLKTSLFETFASFIFLSWIKLLSISYSLLNNTCVITVNRSGGTHVDCTRLYTSPNLRLFHEGHLLAGMIAIIVLCIFIGIPLALLLLYPFKFFHRLLNKSGLHFQALHVFMDSFHSSFRNGTDGGADCRWFASTYLILRIVVVILASILQSRYFFPVASITCMAFVLAVCALQPYKRQAHNIFDATQFFILAAFFGSHGMLTVAQFASENKHFLPSLGISFSFGFLPIVASIAYFVWWVLKVKLSSLRLCARVRQWWQQRRAAIDHSLPDRLRNPQYYQRMELVPTTYEERIHI